MEWIEQHFQMVDEFPRPDWGAIAAVAEENFRDIDQHKLWCSIARSWMQRLISVLDSSYSVYESDNFIILTSESSKYVTIFQKFLERTLKRIVKMLPGIASDEGDGKYVVLIFDDIDMYYSYLSDFYDKDGTYGLSSGVYLNQGYGHFAFPHRELAHAESIAAHEMTHALLSHLPIPTWLNEGIAVTIENMLTGSAPLEMNDELYAQHQSFWGDKEIQEFWSGDSFYRPDKGQELSYHLAQFAVHSLSQDYDNFIAFANQAHFNDGGESAANEVYEGSLGNLIAQYFGEGEWTPRPETWAGVQPSHGLQSEAAEMPLPSRLMTCV
ncbi:hypothetical protein [Exilibacterium tricleocarpae]|uniref:hypothetical protein n=1 Tax=Exilibacterium tricleocarpae TaxID=2591008 RepID=UPI001FE7A400|nr:hypothetical protein [Exilibacterium tricleocarpae]